MDNVRKAAEWAKKNGLEPPKETELNLEYIANAANSNLVNVPLEKLDEIILKINAYNLYLNATKGKLLARIGYVEDKVKRKLGVESSKLINKYKSKDEREAIALKMNEDLNSMNEKLLTLRSMYAHIKDIPYSIDAIIRSMTILYHRKANAK